MDAHMLAVLRYQSLLGDFACGAHSKQSGAQLLCLQK